VSPGIDFAVEGLPPIKRGAESMWGRQLDRVRDLRREAAKKAEGQPPATIEEPVRLEVLVYARPQDGDLDGFVAGICDALQPCPANFLEYVNEEDCRELPAAAHPTNGIGISDDKAVAAIHAERRPVDRSPRYEVSLRW
jgi:hypothetical protein